MILQEVDNYTSRYPDHLEKAVGDVVHNTYGELAVSKVAHSEQMRKLTPRVEELRTPAALTMALLGLMAEEQVINTRLGGRFRRQR